MSEDSKSILHFKNLTIKEKEKLILDNLWGYLEVGKLTALMGHSGSSKTTLLNVISGRHKLISNIQLQGELYLNGQKFTEKTRKLIGYVQQEDSFFERLTVYETALFHASVRISENVPIQQKIDKINIIASKLNLDHVLHNVIGGSDSGIKSLSGGERKRLSILLELLTDPHILMLDEPTSGLDSTTAYNVVQVLKDLSSTGKCIVASIHQPNSYVFHSFDRLILMSHGKMCYFGEVSEISQYFEKLNFPCPSSWNIADHIIEVSYQERNMETLMDMFNSEILPMIQRETTKTVFASQEFNHSENEIDTDVTGTIECKPAQWSSKFSTQLLSLTKRSFKISYRDIFNFMFLIEQLMIGIILGIIWFQLPARKALILDYAGLLFWLSANSFSTSYFGCYFTFISELKQIKREHSASIYRISAYYIAKICSESLMMLSKPLLKWGIAYWMIGLSSPAYFPLYILIFHILSEVGTVYGNIFSCLPLPPKQVITTMSIYFTLILLCGGFFTRSIPYWLGWLKFISPFLHGYRILIEILYSSGLECGVKDIGSFPSCTPENKIVDKNELLKVLEIDFSPWYSIIFLFGSIIFGHLATYIVLLRILKNKGSNRKKRCSCL